MLRIAHGDGSYPRLMNQLAKTDLIILDDWGIQKIAAAQHNDLMEVIEDHHGLRSTLIASVIEKIPVRLIALLCAPAVADPPRGGSRVL